MLTHTAKFPPELIFEVVRFLCERRESEVWSTKAELGTYSLTCKSWAATIRPLIFRELSMESRINGYQFYALVMASHGSEWCIAQNVKRITLRYSLLDAPWIHLVFMCKSRMVRLENIDLFIEHPKPAASLVSLRSIHHHLPRGFPPSLSAVDSLTLSDIDFGDFGELNSVLRSAPNPNSKFYRPGYITLQRITVHNPSYIPPVGLFGHRVASPLTLSVKECTSPQIFLRAILPIEVLPKRTLKMSYPALQLHALLVIEKILGLIFRLPSESIENTANRNEGINRQIVFTLVKDTWNGELFVRADNPDNPAHTFQATISERGTLTRVKIDVVGCHNALSIPWYDIDESIQDALPNLNIFELECFRSWEQAAFDVQGLSRTICTMMPHLGNKGKLTVWDNQIGERKGRVRVNPYV